MKDRWSDFFLWMREGIRRNLRGGLALELAGEVKGGGIGDGEARGR